MSMEEEKSDKVEKLEDSLVLVSVNNNRGEPNKENQHSSVFAYDPARKEVPKRKTQLQRSTSPLSKNIKSRNKGLESHSLTIPSALANHTNSMSSTHQKISINRTMDLSGSTSPLRKQTNKASQKVQISKSPIQIEKLKIAGFGQVFKSSFREEAKSPLLGS